MATFIATNRQFTKKISDKISSFLELRDINMCNQTEKVSSITKGLFNIRDIAKKYMEPAEIYICTFIRSIITSNYGENAKFDGLMIITSIKNNIGFLMLGTEIYYLFCHIYIVKLWIFLNLLSTFLMMYYTLNISDQHNQLSTFSIDDIKRYSATVIGFGIIIIIFFTKNVGMLSIFVIMYLINRTLSNIFKRGF